MAMSCQLCGARRAVVFCGAHAARLCLHCDAALHQQGDHHHHPRAPLCDSCNAAAAHLRCSLPGPGPDGGRVTLCRTCAPPQCSAVGVNVYTGCPSPVDMARLLSADLLDDGQPELEHQYFVGSGLALEDDHNFHSNNLGRGGGGGGQPRARSSSCLQQQQQLDTQEQEQEQNKLRKREERNRAKLRYIDKRNKRKYVRPNNFI
uniref:B box-type domain-containing protein n=1 Tax=Oryza brachyantha TaxID=4533 RepID=J3MAH5_ORYBR